MDQLRAQVQSPRGDRRPLDVRLQGPERAADAADAAEEAEKYATMCVAIESIHQADSATGKRVGTKLIQPRRKPRRRSYVGSDRCADDYSQGT